MTDAEKCIATEIQKHAAAVCKHTRNLQLSRYRLSQAMEEYQVRMSQQVEESEGAMTEYSIAHESKKKKRAAKESGGAKMAEREAKKTKSR